MSAAVELAASSWPKGSSSTRRRSCTDLADGTIASHDTLGFAAHAAVLATDMGDELGAESDDAASEASAARLTFSD